MTERPANARLVAFPLREQCPACGDAVVVQPRQHCDRCGWTGHSRCLDCLDLVAPSANHYCWNAGVAALHEKLERSHPDLRESLSFYGEHAGEQVSLVGMALPDGEKPVLTIWARGTVHLDQPDVVRLRGFCDRWLEALEAFCEAKESP